MANMRVRDAAQHCGVSKSLLDKLRCYGGGPAYMKLGASVIYNTDDLDAWLATHRQAANDNQRAASSAA